MSLPYTPVTNEPIDDTTPGPLYGPTVSRPASPALAQVYFDTTLDEPVWWDGSMWVDANGIGPV